MSLFAQFADFMLQALKIVGVWLHNRKQNFAGNFCLPASSYLFTVKTEMQTVYPQPEALSTPGKEVQLHFFIMPAPDGGGQPHALATLPLVPTEYEAHPVTVHEDTVYRGADKYLARPGRKQANVSVRMA